MWQTQTLLDSDRPCPQPRQSTKLLVVSPYLHNNWKTGAGRGVDVDHPTDLGQLYLADSRVFPAYDDFWGGVLCWARQQKGAIVTSDATLVSVTTPELPPESASWGRHGFLQSLSDLPDQTRKPAQPPCDVRQELLLFLKHRSQ